MWSVLLRRPQGRISWRKFLAVATGLCVAVFAFALTTSSSVSAEPNLETLEWRNGTELYVNNTPLSGPLPASGNNPPGLEQDSIYYTYVEDTDAWVIYFAPGNGPPDNTTAAYIRSYDFSEPNVLTNPSSEEEVQIGGTYSATTDPTCSVRWMSWLVCGATGLLAEGTDWLFSVLEQMLRVETIVNDTNSTLFNTWATMRDIANIAFVIAFLMIIYSQLTGMGLSNYGIKRMWPRLIAAAILVNVSYFICALAVDLSNILGSSLQGIFLDIRQEVLAGSVIGESVPDWQGVAVLAGGATAVIGGVLMVSSGSIFLLIPALVSVGFAVLVAVAVLAARQALIVILIILAPLAFVAFLLPNTERWFNKWRDIFMTMMIFYPAFSIVFGGSQLAGALILSSAQNFVIIIVGLAVQAAPLFLTPLLIKLSGSLLGRIAGQLNSPGSALRDKAAGWAKGRRDISQAKYMAKRREQMEEGKKRARFNPRTRMQLRGDDMRRTREADKEDNETAATALFDQSATGKRLHEKRKLANIMKETSSAVGDRHVQEGINTVGSHLYVQNARLEDAKIGLESETVKTTALVDELKSGRGIVATGELSAIMQSMRDNSEMVALNGMRGEAAKRAWNEEWTAKLEKNTDTISDDGDVKRTLQEYAGGVQGVVGAQRAYASAISQQSKAHGESISNATTILSHGNYDDDIIGEFARGRSVAGVPITVTDDIKEAAIMKIAGGANTNAIVSLMRDIEINPTKENQDFRQAFADTLLSNSNKPKFAGAGVLKDIKNGVAPPVGKARIDTYVAQTLNADKLGSAQLLTSHDKEYLDAVLATLSDNQSGIALDQSAINKVAEQIFTGATNPRFSGNIGERKNVLKDIYKKLHSDYGATFRTNNGSPSPANIDHILDR